jgi:ABC-type branched-subunit amino acid transport system ATPase component
MAASGIVFVAMDKWIDLGQWFGVVSGVAVVLTVIKNPEGLAAGGHALANRIPLPRFRPRRRAAEVDAVPDRPPFVPTVDPPPVLDVRGLSVKYGGVVAVDEVTLEVRPGTVVGLIGPNGAGKTSVIDAITGFARSKGSVAVAGETLDGLAPHKRVRRGLGRTFQSIELYDDLSVDENVSVAAFAGGHGDQDAAVTRALALVGIDDLRDRPAGELSQGQRQLVSMARACAAEPQVLLLDEPAAGLDSTESQWLGDRIRGIADTGTAILLVDHDVALVFGLCDYLYVLDFGRVIAEGVPDDIRGNRAVAEAYLGGVQAIEEPTEVTEVQA